MEHRTNLSHILVSALAGFSTALVITITLYQSNLHTIIDWGITLSLLTLGFGLPYFLFLSHAWNTFRAASITVKYWGAVLVVASALSFAFSFGLITFIPFFLVSFLIIASKLNAFDLLFNQKLFTRFEIAWLLGSITSFLALGFFQNFYPSRWEFIFFTILLNVIFTLFFDVILEQRNLSNLKENLIPIATLGLGLLLIFLTWRLLLQYPTLLHATILPASSLIPVYLALVILSQPWIAFLLQKLDSTDWRSAPVIVWIKRNFSGLLLGSTITIATYALATVFVSSDLGLTDNYFDTDSPLWVNFLTANTKDVLDIRAVHPIILLILRPLVWLLSLLLNGDKFHAVIFFNTLAGGACIYLTWLFFKQKTGNTSYALLIAALLGFATSHLLLSVFLESYIFSALALIVFMLLLQSKSNRLTSLTINGAIVFGITVTNFIQTCIAFLLTKRDIKKTIRYVFTAIAFATLLTFVQALTQPNSQPFYIASNLNRENAFKRDILGVPFSETISRANVIARTITLFNVVAPRPLILLEEIGCTFPCFNTIRFFGGKYQYASYIGFGSWLVRTWFIVLGLAGLLFARNLWKSPQTMALHTALALNLLFNFALHMNYGDDPMLYSPNWTYALIFFVGLSFERYANKKWLQIGFLLFLTALLFNNLELFHKLLDAILPFFS